MSSLRSRRWVRSACLLAVFAIGATALSSCQQARAGTRCRTTQIAHDSTHLLKCTSGRWRRGLTIVQFVAVLNAIKAQEDVRRAGSPPPPPTAPAVPALNVTTVVGGLDHPWDVAFAPGGEMWFTQRSGSLSVLAGGTIRSTPVTGLYVAGELGLMGLAVDPGFATNRRLYTCQAEATGGPPEIHVVRWTAAWDNTVAVRDPVALASFPGTTNNRHAGCQLEFGPDGYLWVGTGDATTGSNPQDLNSNAGKVLRMTTDGLGAPGNPFGGNAQRIYTLGHRNVQGLAFRPNGQAFSVEHGTGCDDEINRLSAGANFGWAPFGRPGNYDESRPMTDFARVPSATSAVWSSGCPTVAPSGATFLVGPQWGAWNGALAVAHLKASMLRVFRLDDAGRAVVETWTTLTDRGRLRAAGQGPDGALYVTTDASPGSILRVAPA